MKIIDLILKILGFKRKTKVKKSAIYGDFSAAINSAMEKH